MNIIEAIQKAREVQAPTSDGCHAIERRAWKDSQEYPASTGEELIYIPDDDTDPLFDEKGFTASFSVEDMLRNDWEVPKTVPEMPEE